MVFSVYEAEDTTTRQDRNEEDNHEETTEDILNEIEVIESIIVKREAYLRRLQARRGQTDWEARRGQNGGGGGGEPNFEDQNV